MNRSNTPVADRGRPRTAVGLWNVYFLAKFGLVWAGYLRFHTLGNLALFLLLLVPMKPGVLDKLRRLAALIGGAALIWHESWLPGWESIVENARALTGFSPRYMFELAWDFINWPMAASLAVLTVGYLLVRDYVRVTAVTVCLVVWLAARPLWQETGLPAPRALPAVSATTAPDPAVFDDTASATAADAKQIENWYRTFLAYEKDRRAALPDGINAKDTPFDIVLLNVCSLSTDDLAAAGLTAHQALKRFDVRFEHFNSATSYSGPATLRLLTGACGQPSHDTLYGARRPDCELMNRLDALGFKQYLFMDHSGEYDDYLNTLRRQAGLTPQLTKRRYPLKYMSFNDESIADTRAVLRHWLSTVRTAGDKRTVTLMNFIALHDGNRLPRHSRAEPFAPRAKAFLDALNGFMNDLEKSGRKTLLVLVPEHGAAVRGDTRQTARLRETPSPTITEVPTMVKFFGVKRKDAVPVTVSGSTSYLALSELIGRVVEKNAFAPGAAPLDVRALTRDLPRTHRVSENAQAKVLHFKGADYVKLHRADWEAYAAER
ncbi:MAG: cellulose biosynthesis protein BcsG [Duodenibacillus sp.]